VEKGGTPQHLFQSLQQSISALIEKGTLPAFRASK
jgi:hypothetical protein